MLLSNIRKWDSEFFNTAHICIPENEQILRRLGTNLNYYFENYILIFLAIFFGNLIFQFKLLTLIIISIAIWSVSCRLPIAQTIGKREQLILFLTNLSILIFIAGSQLFYDIGFAIFFIFLHSFLITEHGSETLGYIAEDGKKFNIQGTGVLDTDDDDENFYDHDKNKKKNSGGEMKSISGGTIGNSTTNPTDSCMDQSNLSI